MSESSTFDWPRLKKSLDRPLLVLAGIALGTLVLGHLLGVTSWELIEPHTHWAIRLLVGAVVFLCAAAWLRVHRFRRCWNFTAFTAALAAGHWVAMDFHHFLGHSLHLPILAMIGIAWVGFFICRSSHHHARESWKNWVTFSREPSSERVKSKPARHLVLFLSPPSTVPRPGYDGRSLAFANDEGGWVNLSGTLGEDIRKSANIGFHNWLQLLRAIEPHTTLETLWIVVSQSEKNSGAATPIPDPGAKAINSHGSAIYGQMAQRWLQSYLPKCRISVSSPQDFEDFKAMLKFVRSKILGPLHSHSREELIIDITGGMKITSVLGAFLTANDQAVFQYVQTMAANGKEISAQIYDIRHDSGPDIPG